MLDLVRLSPRPVFPPGGRDLYRQIAVLSGMEEGQEVLVVGSGTGVTLEYFVREMGVQGAGVEPDRSLASMAEERLRRANLRSRAQIQNAPVDDLPFRDGVFDLVVVELAALAWTEPEALVREVVRVAAPGAHLAMIQLVWKAPVEPSRRQALARHLGVSPVLLVEVKRLLREVGVVDLHVEGWTDEVTAFRPALKKPFPDFAELFTLPEKLGILRRAWGRWGWRGVGSAIGRELTVHRILTRERILGLDLIMGRTPADASGPEAGEDEARTLREVEGLPLFVGDDEGG